MIRGSYGGEVESEGGFAWGGVGMGVGVPGIGLAAPRRSEVYQHTLMYTPCLDTWFNIFYHICACLTFAWNWNINLCCATFTVRKTN